MLATDSIRNCCRCFYPHWICILSLKLADVI